MTQTKIIFRAHDWINLKTCTPVFGVQAKRVGYGGWMHVNEGNKPMFFTQRRQRDRAIKRLKRETDAKWEMVA